MRIDVKKLLTFLDFLLFSWKQSLSLSLSTAILAKMNITQFTSFSPLFLFSSSRCSHEYIDLYTEIPDSEPMDLIHSPFGGRYCGQIPPRRRVSLYRTAVLGFFTDKNSTEDILFQGSYLFFKDGESRPHFVSHTSSAELKKRQARRL